MDIDRALALTLDMRLQPRWRRLFMAPSLLRALRGAGFSRYGSWLMTRNAVLR